MSTIDPKWIQYDSTKLTTVIDAFGINELTLRDDISLSGISVEYVNGSKLTVSDVAPIGDITENDIWIETP